MRKARPGLFKTMLWIGLMIVIIWVILSSQTGCDWYKNKREQGKDKPRSDNPDKPPAPPPSPKSIMEVSQWAAYALELQGLDKEQPKSLGRIKLERR